MTAYLVVELAITDPVAFARYRELVHPTVAAYDGRYLVRGGAMVPLEGDWHPERVTIIAFPSLPERRTGAGLVGFDRVRRPEGDSAGGDYDAHGDRRGGLSGSARSPVRALPIQWCFG